LRGSTRRPAERAWSIHDRIGSMWAGAVSSAAACVCGDDVGNVRRSTPKPKAPLNFNPARADRVSGSSTTRRQTICRDRIGHSDPPISGCSNRSRPMPAPRSGFKIGEIPDMSNVCILRVLMPLSAWHGSAGGHFRRPAGPVTSPLGCNLTVRLADEYLAPGQPNSHWTPRSRGSR